MDFVTVSEAAEQVGVLPRRLSDLFYQRKLCQKTCPVVGRARIIPASYLERIKAVLAREERIKAARNSEA